MTRARRRVEIPAPAGSDPQPGDRDAELAAEDRPEAWGDAPRASDSNDDRLRENVPPHNVDS